MLGLGVVLSTAYYSSNQAMVQRALGARTEWDAKAGVLLAGLAPEATDEVFMGGEQDVVESDEQPDVVRFELCWDR